MDKSKFYRKLTDAVRNGISKAIDGDDMFDEDDGMLSPLQDDIEDSSVYVNHSKWYDTVLSYVRRGWKFDGRRMMDKEHMDKLEKGCSVEEREILSGLVFGYSKLDPDTRELMERYNMRIGIVYCLGNVGNVEYHGSNDRYVELCGRYNIIVNGKLLSDTWFDDCNNAYDGFISVKLNGEWNFIDKDGNMLSELWFDNVYEFSEGYAIVRMDDVPDRIHGSEFNFIGKDGKLLSETWFDNVYDFKEGFADVCLHGKWNHIRQDGSLLSESWFDDIYGFHDGHAAVKRGNSWNFINSDGSMLSDTWFMKVRNFENGYAKVLTLDGKSMEIDDNGDLYPA